MAIRPRTPAITEAAARKLLGLPSKGAFTDQELTAAFRTCAKEAHPDAGGSDAAMAKLNAARDMLDPQAVVTTTFTTAPSTTTPPAGAPLILVISADGLLSGPTGLRLGHCGSRKAAEEYCDSAGWRYTVAGELPPQPQELQAVGTGEASDG